ncbi:hypothetical protein [Rhodococcus koreensis]
MTRILRNTDLSTGTWSPVIEGYEPCAVAGHNVAMIAGNHYAAMSTDSGRNFTKLSPHDVVSRIGETFCCDQRLDYVPKIDHFIWTLLSDQGTIVLAVNSSEPVSASSGSEWYIYKLRASNFDLDASFDYPQVSYGNDYLYVTAGLVGDPGGTLIIRIPLVDIKRHQALHPQAVREPEWLVCPCQLGGLGIFAGFADDGTVKVYWSPENTNAIHKRVIPISTVPVKDFSSITPDGDDWLPETSKISSTITGAARSGNDLWLAWSAGRKYGNDQSSSFPQPHIEMAIVDLAAMALKGQQYIWNREFAFAWPSLAANFEKPQAIGISFDYGGPTVYPQHAVGTLFPGRHFLRTTSAAKSSGAGGHYNDIRMNFPSTNQFVTGGFVQSKSNADPSVKKNRPHYIVFEPSLGT